VNLLDTNIHQNQHSEDAQKLEAIFETAIDGIITIDTNGIVESYNSAAAKLFGFSAEEVIGNNISMLMPEPDRTAHDDYIERYRKTRKAHIIGIGREVTGKKKDGTIFPMRLAVSEVELSTRKIYTGIIHDLSDVKQAEQKFKQLNEALELIVKERTEKLSEAVNKLLEINLKLENEITEREKVEEALRQSEIELRAALQKEIELSELKSRFVSMASHEFRTPLSTILSSASIIGRYTQNENQLQREKHINRIKSAVNNLTGILNDFLSLSKLEEGIIEYQPTEFEIIQFCKNTVDEIRGLLKSGQYVAFEGDLPETVVHLDQRVLKNVLFNLLSNASKYSGEGTKITCRHTIVNQYLYIQVIDQGIGIPESEQQHLFGRFFRASNSLNIQGTGLGLNIVKQYIELMKGTVSYTSEENRGSTFSITIPLKNK
jgi:two-component system, LuxR family, sensor kinase FixL